MCLDNMCRTCSQMLKNFDSNCQKNLYARLKRIKADRASYALFYIVILYGAY